MKKINIILIDDHKSLADILNDNLNQHDDFESTAVYNIEDLYKNLNNQYYDVLLLDLNLQDKSGFDVIEYVRRKYEAMKILILSGELDVNTIKMAFSKKVEGFISKTQKLSTIIRGIKSVYEGNTFLCSKISEILYYDRSPFFIDITRLTKREKQVLMLIGNGFESDKIAEELNLSNETIKTHRKNIRNKLNLNSYGDLVKFAVENKKFLN
jgi:DNA-binding NarL/FixJ family response regulator